MLRFVTRSYRFVTFCYVLWLFVQARHIFSKPFEKICAKHNYATRVEHLTDNVNVQQDICFQSLWLFLQARHIFQSLLKKYAPNTITQQGQEERKTQKGRRILIKSFFSHLTKSDAEIISLIGFRSQGNIGTKSNWTSFYNKSN